MSKFIFVLILAFISLDGYAQTTSGTGSGVLSVTGISLPDKKCVVTLLESDFKFNENKIEITKREDCNPNGNFTYALYCGSSPCDFSTHRVYKEIFGVVDGKIKLVKTVEGKIIPASKKEESFEWPE